MVTSTKKTRRMRELEERFGKPIDELLREQYRSLGTLERVGQALGIGPATVWFWMFKFGIDRRQWVLPEENC